MLVIIQTADGKRISLEAEPTTSIMMLKQAIERKMENAPLHLQKLIYAGRQLEDNSLSLSDYNVQKEGIITVVIKLEPDPEPWAPIKFSGYDLTKKKRFNFNDCCWEKFESCRLGWILRSILCCELW